MRCPRLVEQTEAVELEIAMQIICMLVTEGARDSLSSRPLHSLETINLTDFRDSKARLRASKSRLLDAELRLFGFILYKVRSNEA